MRARAGSSNRPAGPPAAGVVFAVLLAAACSAPQPAVDLVVRGGRVVDGTGGEPAHADVAIRGDRIVAVGTLDGTVAAREIDATGLVVAPGFVDLHGHADLILLADLETQERLLAAKLRQGVTTLIVGNCGLGAAPANGEGPEILAAVNGWMTPAGVEAGALDVAAYLDRLERGGVVVNVGTLVPHGPVRVSVMGLETGEPSAEELSSMRRAVIDGLRAGAFGLSSGLIYPPGMYSATDELVALAEPVAGAGRLFTAHVRGSSETLLPATRELIEIARRSGARVHHSHFEAVGEGFWDRIPSALALEDAARDEGLGISHDVFPYTRAATMMSAIFPPWSLEGGLPALLERLQQQESRARIESEIASRVPDWPPWREGGWPHNLVGAVGWDGIRVASVGANRPSELIGRSLAQIAAEQDRDPFDVVVELMLSERGRVGQQVDEISGREDHLEPLVEILRHPAAAVISDAEDYGRGAPHPAHAGAFVRALRLNRERILMPLEEMVHRMTGYPASLIGLDDRGVIRVGAGADLVLFDPETVSDAATWSDPRRPAEGVRFVILNGAVIVAEGRYVGGAHGSVLRAD
jgi:N-acyl-D-aspartate/D-glutamate deacylase